MTLKGRCFCNCPFIVSHGNLLESIKLDMGWSFPETIFASIEDFLRSHPSEIVTLMLIVTHGNTAPSVTSVQQRLNASGLTDFLWNPEQIALTTFPTLGDMRESGRTLMLSWGSDWGPAIAGSCVNSSDVAGADEVCGKDTTACMEGWDSLGLFQLEPQRAMFCGASPPSASQLLMIENLSSRRGRPDKDAAYWPLPNIEEDFPFLYGGNPAQAAEAAQYEHVMDLEARWSSMLEAAYPGMVANFILVDFFNTTTPDPGTPSRSLLPNPDDGLVRAVRDVNTNRLQRLRDQEQQ